jgi:hypothetical protein
MLLMLIPPTIASSARSQATSPMLIAGLSNRAMNSPNSSGVPGSAIHG